jgi:protein SCO1/2
MLFVQSVNEAGHCMSATSSYPEQQRPGLNNRKLILLWLGLLAIPLLAVFLFAVFQPVKVVPRIGLAPGFSFTDMNGARLTNEDLPCVDSSATMQQVQALAPGLESGGIPVKLVTILLDAEAATPERMRAYAERVGVAPELWRVVTGTPERLKQVVGGGFGLYYTQDATGAFQFEPRIALVDGNGLLRAQYKRGLPDVDFIVRDLSLIFDEVRNSSGASGLVYEAAHLFACYATY